MEKALETKKDFFFFFIFILPSFPSLILPFLCWLKTPFVLQVIFIPNQLWSYSCASLDTGGSILQPGWYCFFTSRLQNHIERWASTAPTLLWDSNTTQSKYSCAGGDRYYKGGKWEWQQWHSLVLRRQASRRHSVSCIFWRTLYSYRFCQWTVKCITKTWIERFHIVQGKFQNLFVFIYTDSTQRLTSLIQKKVGSTWKSILLTNSMLDSYLSLLRAHLIGWIKCVHPIKNKNAAEWRTVQEGPMRIKNLWSNILLFQQVKVWNISEKHRDLCFTLIRGV